MSSHFPQLFANGFSSSQANEFSLEEFFDVSRSPLLHCFAHIPSPLSVAPDAPK